MRQWAIRFHGKAWLSRVARLRADEQAGARSYVWTRDETMAFRFSDEAAVEHWAKQNLQPGYEIVPIDPPATNAGAPHAG